MAMGAVIGVAAFGRTQEKLAGANAGGATPAPAFPAAPVASPFPAAAPVASPFPSAPAASPFPAAPAPAPVFVSSSGKPGPAPQVDPLI